MKCPMHDKSNDMCIPMSESCPRINVLICEGLKSAFKMGQGVLGGCMENDTLYEKGFRDGLIAMGERYQPGKDKTNT